MQLSILLDLNWYIEDTIKLSSKKIHFQLKFNANLFILEISNCEYLDKKSKETIHVE